MKRESIQPLYVNEREYYKAQIIETIEQIEKWEAMSKIYAVARTHLMIQEENKEVAK